MKKCLKCNEEFSDDSLFCPKCGEQLVSEETCPYCHKTINPEDSFCRYCGKKLEKIRACPKCGKQVEEDVIFCPKCGNRIDGHFDNQLASSKDIKENANKYFNYIFIAVSAILAILFIVGMFGDFIIAEADIHGLRASQSQSIKWFFGEGAKNLKDIKKAHAFPEYYDFSLIEFVILNIFYFGGLVGVIISIILMTINFVKVLTKNEKIKRAPLISLIISVLPYLLTISFDNFVNANSATENLQCMFGWGTTMLVVVVFCSLCALLALNIYESKKDSKSIFILSLKGILPILLVIIAIFGCSLVVSYNVDSVSYSVNAGNYVSSLLLSYSDGTITELPSSFGIALAGYIIILISGLATVTCVFLSASQKTELSLASFVVTLVLYIIGTSLSITAMNEQQSSYVGGMAIMTYILGAFIIAGFVGLIILDKKNNTIGKSNS